MTWRAISAGAYRSLENNTEPSPSETSNAPEREGPAADITLDTSQGGAGHCITRTSRSKCIGCRSAVWDIELIEPRSETNPSNRGARHTEALGTS